MVPLLDVTDLVLRLVRDHIIPLFHPLHTSAQWILARYVKLVESGSLS